MKQSFIAVILVSLCASASVFAQNTSDNEGKKSRVVVTDSLADRPSIPDSSGRKVLVIGTDGVADSRDTTVEPLSAEKVSALAAQTRSLRFDELQRQIDEATRQMRIKPLRTGMGEAEQTTDIIRIAFFDWDKEEVDYAVISKVAFLDSKSDAITTSEGGKWLRINTLRGNGVNTPIIIFDDKNKTHLPLIVQYPIEKYGKFVEMAYYVSSHPGVVTSETVNAGRLYVRNVLNTASSKLRGHGIFIQPKIIDMADRLALVEHVDHARFRNEYAPRIFNDVYMLYALNRGQTYRYSVSSAGAGGMVQMIPATYRMIRSRYYSVGLIPDFVDGMRDHVNAAQAMLLYMQMTWNDLISNQTVYSAIESGWATPEQLMAAGYNSNPTRLSGYIRRGGENWANLIPRETKIYLQILSAVEQHVPQDKSEE